MTMDELKYKDGKFTINGAEIVSGDDIATISANTQQFSVFEDPEGRTEITTDADGKLLGYRDKDGMRCEHKMQIDKLYKDGEPINYASK